MPVSGRPGGGSLAAGLVLGAVADAVLGDPRRGHPVAGYGQAAALLERAVYRDDRAAGVAYTTVCVGAPVLLASLAERAARRPVPRTALVAAMAWTVLGGRSLRREAEVLGAHLAAGDLTAARARLPHLVGRDGAGLDAAEISRAVVESVAENTGDAVVAPVFWGAVAGVPGLVGYRAVNTLDAMVGHRSPRYRRFGWAAARLDDAANLAPARLTAALVALVSGCPARVARVVMRDASKHPSPNAGWCEAAFAAALDVRLGGVNRYQGMVDDRASLGDGRRPGVADIDRARRLSRSVTVAATALVAALAAARRR